MNRSIATKEQAAASLPAGSLPMSARKPAFSWFPPLQKGYPPLSAYGTVFDSHPDGCIRMSGCIRPVAVDFRRARGKDKQTQRVTDKPEPNPPKPGEPGRPVPEDAPPTPPDEPAPVPVQDPPAEPVKPPYVVA